MNGDATLNLENGGIVTVYAMPAAGRVTILSVEANENPLPFKVAMTPHELRQLAALLLVEAER